MDKTHQLSLGESQNLVGSPSLAISFPPLRFFAGLISIVFSGVAGPVFREVLGLSGFSLGLLLSSPHLSKAVLRVPFGAWVDKVGGRVPFLLLLCSSCVGMAGLVVVLSLYPPDRLGRDFFGVFLVIGLLGGAGAATFSVGVPQTAYWFSSGRQGYALGIYAGVGNIGPGLFNILMPLLVGVVGLALAYAGWLAFLLVATFVYWYFAADAYYFQLRNQGMESETAKEIASKHGQELFPVGTVVESLKSSASSHHTWILVLLYSVSFGGGFTALTAWFPTYWYTFHGLSLLHAGGMAAIFTVFGSLIRVWGGKLSDLHGGERVAALSFIVMALGACILSLTSGTSTAFVGMVVLAGGMGIANAAVFKLVPKYVPEAIGGASGWIGGVGGAGTLLVLPLLGVIVDHQGVTGFASGFWVYVILSLICAGVVYSMGSYRKSD